MGLERAFSGRFRLNKRLAPEHHAYLTAFSETRHVKWNVDWLAHPDIPDLVTDSIREAVGLPFGPEGAYYVGPVYEYTRKRALINGNEPPLGQPGLWCQWVPNTMGTAIVWDGGEKFYEFNEWLRYLIQHFLTPWGYILNGTVRFAAEVHRWSDKHQDVLTTIDYGRLVVKDNRLEVHLCKRRPQWATSIWHAPAER